MTKQNITTPIGTFGKGVEGSKTINFSRSGGKNCDRSCPFHPETTAAKSSPVKCYAVSTEKYKTTITLNLERKEKHLTEYLGILERETRKESFQHTPWVRFSAFGSLPEACTMSEADKATMGRIASNLKPLVDSGRVHVPVETLTKYREYRSMGLPTRLSLQDQSTEQEAVETMRDGIKVSMVAIGKKIGRESRSKANIREGYAMAKRLREAGQMAVNCPAISKWRPSYDNQKSQCGSCTACGSDKVNAIIYPWHS